MPENTPETFSITSIEFIFRRLWLFISSVVIIMSLVYAKVSIDPVEYESKAVLSFEMGEEAAADRFADKKLASIKKNLVSKALLGDNIRSIIRGVWPEIDETREPVKYNELLEMLRHPKKGIQIDDDKKIPPNLLKLSFKSDDPETCFNALQTTIAVMKRENKKAIEDKTEASLTFLRDQLKFYKDKLNGLNGEATGIQDELVERFPELTERERDLVSGIGVQGEKGLVKQGSLETFVMYDEMITKLNLELLEAQKKKENLKKHLEKGTLTPRLKSAKRPDEDIFVGEYSKAIANKELQIAELVAGGYTKNHPEVKKIQSQINRLRTMTGDRMTALKEEKPGGYDQDATKERVLSEIEEVDFQIESLKSKINLIKDYRKVSRDQLKGGEGDGKSNVHELVARLKELEREKEINEGYYLDIRKQLEEAELKSRLERDEGGFKIDVIEEPSVPLNPISYQKVKLLMLGMIISLMVGTGLAYFIDSLDNSVRTAKELRELFSVPVLASIDRMNTNQEIIAHKVRRNAIIAGLIVFVILSKILFKVFSAIF